MAKLTPAQRFETRWQRATERAIAGDLNITADDSTGIHFSVESGDNVYTVRVNDIAALDAACNCDGAMSGFVCKHVALAFFTIGAIDSKGNRVA